MQVTRQKLVKRWPAFEFDGVKLKAEVHTPRSSQEMRADEQRRNVFLMQRRERKLVETHPNSPEVTRLSYIVYEGQQSALFIGMSVNNALRKRGIGQHLLSYFMEHVAEEDGLRFVGTGKLHKPVLALIAKEAGLVPKSTDCMAEILPPDQSSRLEVPAIRFLKRDIPECEMKSGSVHNLFYEVVPPGAYSEPVDPARVVALHTGYRPELDYEQVAAEALAF